MMTQLFTIGYEGRAQHDVIALLDEADIELLVDVRIRSQSRKPGLSKTSLAAGLADAGIDYLHLRDLGTPIPIRAEFRANNTEHARAEYLRYLRDDEAAQHALAELLRLAQERRVAILCFEHDPRVCHRMVITEELARTNGIEAVHLGAPAVAH
jgi:uncharacterized protein (DUF488 family)